MPYLKKAKKQRNPSNNRIERQKIYNTDRWHKLRASKLMQSPLCEVCLSKGVITPAFHRGRNLNSVPKQLSLYYG